MSVHLSTPVKNLTRVGSVTASRLSNIGIVSVKDLLEHYPFRFEDYSVVTPIASLTSGQKACIRGIVTYVKEIKTPRKGMRLTEAVIDDESGSLRIVWFNQPYLAQTIREGTALSCAGAVAHDFEGLLMKNPVHEPAEDAVHTGRLVPIYPTTHNITQKQIRFLVSQALEAAQEYQDPLPELIIKEHNFPTKTESIKAIHEPTTKKEYDRAVRRLKFEELFVLQLASGRARAAVRSHCAPPISFDQARTKELVASLPFSLTDDQRRVAWQILQDIEQATPMTRLLQGDVGSGKTVVAAIAAHAASRAGHQTVIMAPTEILAFQHYKTMMSVLPGEAVGLLTGSRAESTLGGDASKKELKKMIEDGSITILIGTHAVIQKDASFKSPALVVVDEQHRFGVEQRKKLVSRSSSGTVPHLLSMTATPIPRSLALTVYGDLDISTIRTMPKNRKPIITRLLPHNKRSEAYAFINKHIENGRQVFVVCPLIEESDALGVRAATHEYEALQKSIFSNRTIGLLHGKLSSDEKKRIMDDFARGAIDILVTTSVIEVGVDVPNASIMLIEGSERFGLSQLHQFRGRVGRGEHQSYCFIAHGGGQEAAARLSQFTRAKDGFEIAELDLALRGPGNMCGTEQSGYTELRMASMYDIELVSLAREEAKKMTENSKSLDHHPLLNNAVLRLEQRIHFE